MNNLAEWVIEQAADALIYADIEGNIQRWNGAAAKMLGFSKDEAIGQSLDIIIPVHLREAHWRGFNAAIASGQLKLSGAPTLTRAVHKEGQKMYVEMTFALVANDQNEVVGSVCMARDVTERVAKERAARN